MKKDGRITRTTTTVADHNECNQLHIKNVRLKHWNRDHEEHCLDAPYAIGKDTVHGIAGLGGTKKCFGNEY